MTMQMPTPKTKAVLYNFWFVVTDVVAWPWRALRQSHYVDVLEARVYCYQSSAQTGWEKVGEYAAEIHLLKDELATLKKGVIDAN